MGFEVMQNSYGRIWVPVDNANRTYPTLYVGQLVQFTSDGAVNLGQASGALDTTGETTPAGVVVGTNRRYPLFSSTYKSEYITAEAPHHNTSDWVLHGGSGPLVVGETSAHVQVDLIGPDSVLKGRLFNGSYGTAMTVGTVTTGNANGTGFTCSAGLMDAAGTIVADQATVYGRTGGNRGIYRITTDASATIKTVDYYFPYDITAGDKFVGVHQRAWGPTKCNTDSQATFIDVAQDTGTNYWGIFVIKLDLSTAGGEYVIFRFEGAHFTNFTPATA